MLTENSITLDRHLWKCVSGIFQFRGFYPPSLENVFIKGLVLSVAYRWLEHAAWKFRQENSFLTCNNTVLSHLPHFSCAVLIFLVFFFLINSMLLNQLDRLLPHYAFQVSVQCLMKNSILLCTLWVHHRVKTGIFILRYDIVLLNKRRFTLQNTMNSTDEKSHIQKFT